MLYSLYGGIMVFSIILLMAAVFTRISSQLKALICALAMGTFALLALSSFNVTEVYVNVDNVMTQYVLFESWDAHAMAWFNALGFIVVFILFIVNALLSIADYRTPMWKKRIEEHKKSLADN